MGLVVTRTAKYKGLPLKPESLRTLEGGQVAGLGKAAVQRILGDHGITKVLAEEGGRTSRGSLGLMKNYVAILNELSAKGFLNLEDAEEWWITKVRAHFASEGPKFQFDPGKSLSANIEDLLSQAKDVQSHSGGTNYVGAMLQHLVGAKLDIVLGKGKIEHHGFSVADLSTERKGDFQVDLVTFHVTTHPTEALIRKCKQNLRNGFKPVVVTIDDGVAGAKFLLKNSQVEERVDVLDAIQFLTANVYEHSIFQASDYKPTMTTLLQRYNEIVVDCETDPALTIKIPS